MSRKSDRKGERKLNLNQEIYKEEPKEEHSISLPKLLLGKLKTENSYMEINLTKYEVTALWLTYSQHFFPCVVDTFSFIY